MTSTVSSDSSSQSSSMGPSAGSVLHGPYQDEGVEKAIGARVSQVVKKSGRKGEISSRHLSLYPSILAFLSITCSCEVVLEENSHSSYDASPSTRKIGPPGGTPTRGGALAGSGRYVERECWSRAHRRCRLFPASGSPSSSGKRGASAHAQ